MSTDQETPGTEDPISQSAGVWPPPPTDPAYLAAVQQGSRPVVSYQPALALTKCLIGLYMLRIMTNSSQIALILMRNVSTVELQKVMYGVQRIIELIIVVCFLRWTYIISKNLRAFGVPGVQNSPGWAVGYFIVPILSLYRPYVVYQELWQASNPAYDQSQDRDWKNSKESLFIGFWWGAWIFSSFSAAIRRAQFISDPTSLDTLLVNLANELVSALSAGLGIALIRMLSKRQAAKYAALSEEA